MSSVKSKIVSKSKPISFFVFVLLFFITQFLAYQNYLLLQSEQRQSLLTELNTLESKIESVLQAARVAVGTLTYVITKNQQLDNFEAVSEHLVNTNPYIDALQLVDSLGFITHVFPIIGNQTVFGYNILKDSLRNNEAQQAIDEKRLFFAGPFPLKQGDIGIVGRLAYFKKDKFIGFVAVIIKMNTLIEALDLQNHENSSLIFQLSKINPETGIEEFFFPRKLTLQNKQLVVSKFLPDGNWTIYAELNTKPNWAIVVAYPLLGLTLALIGAFLVYILMDEPKKLEQLVRSKTEELAKQQYRYRILLENSSDVVLVLNANEQITYSSPSFAKKLGITESDIYNNSWKPFIYEDDYYHVQKILNECKLTDKATVQLTFRVVGKNSELHWYEGTFTNLLHQIEILGIVVNMHDVTERMHYLDEIQFQNRRLREIAWTQSHIVRAPLARIMGLVILLKESEFSSDEYQKLLHYIMNSSKELDSIIGDISKKAERINWNSNRESF